MAVGGAVVAVGRTTVAVGGTGVFVGATVLVGFGALVGGALVGMTVGATTVAWDAATRVG